MNNFKSFWAGSPHDKVEMEMFDKSKVTMQEISFKVAKEMIVKNHYSHRFPTLPYPKNTKNKGK